MERWPRQLYRISFFLFTIITFVSGNNITYETWQPFSQGHIQKRAIKGIECYTGNGATYRGKVAVTSNGDQCLMWSLSSQVNEKTHPRKGLINNYCRNPDNFIQPWCWINHEKAINGPCDVTKCSEMVVPVKSYDCFRGNGHKYRGEAKRTERGYRCLAWDSSEINDKTHPGNDLRKNYCRNPTKEHRPWCWVNYADRRYQYCRLPKCSDIPSFLYCKLRQFYCSKENKCISTQLRCNMDINCLDGEDEVGCFYSLNYFKKSENSILKIFKGNKYDHEKYKNVSNEWCAGKCYWIKHANCKSFTYETEKRTCYISAWKVDYRYAEIVPLNGFDYYEPQREIPYTVMLSGGIDATEGNVEVIINEVKYHVCDDDWDNLAASVVCRMVGYQGGVATTNSRFGSDSNNDIVLNEVDCRGIMDDLNQCQAVVGMENNDCDSSELAGVICNKERYPKIRMRVYYTANNISECGKRPYDELPISPPAFKEESPFMTLLPKAERQFKIAFGKDAQYGEFPWQVRITRVGFSYSESPSFHCGGTIISEDWILSAAHCFINRHKYWYGMYVGDHNRWRRDLEEEIFEVLKIIPHEDFNEIRMVNDIALIKIRRKGKRGIKFNAYVQAACLPDPFTEPLEDTMCLISGWGETHGGVYPDTLLAGEVPIISYSECDRLHSRGRIHITPDMLCAGYVRGGRVDACIGDSGGPLVCKIAGTYILFGITSWGRGCAERYSPGVYTNVKAYMHWIGKKIKEAS